MPKKLTKEKFIQKSKKIHGQKYDYSQVNYIHSKINVNIYCSIHGLFSQKPDTHLRGKGCSDCGGTKKLTTQQFIIKANKIHKNKYKYNGILYFNSRSKVKIICPNHGFFYQKANSHLNGDGCRECHKEKLSKLYKRTNKDFVKEAQKIHGNLYDYSKMRNIKYRKKVTIICNTHGKFYQRSDVHLAGHGCYRCNKFKSKKEIIFLNYCKILDINRQRKIESKLVDGFEPKTNTIYEFLGDYWHGNLEKFNSNKINFSCNKTFKQLNKNTFKRLYYLKSKGYNVKYIWENDWNNFIKEIDEKPKIQKI